MNTTRNKRWNGRLETLKADYLSGVIGQMDAYGDRVQFALNGPGQKPLYQVINTDGKKMAFDGNHHLYRPEGEEFTGSNATGVMTMDQIRLAMAGGAPKSTGTVRAVRATGVGSRGPSAATKAKDLVDTEKYEYFKNNRSMLPAEIGEHSNEITTLMRGGMSAEAAFSEVLKRHF